jgi:chromosome segregation ATPase
MEATNEKTYSSPQRKLVKFFERSRNQWKAKAGAAKTMLKRLGGQVRRLERRTADSQPQLAALRTQVAEWRARHEETARELEALKKKYPHLSGES